MKPNKIILVVGSISMIVGIISRITMIPLPPAGLEAGALLSFASACFLLSIAWSLVDKK